MPSGPEGDQEISDHTLMHPKYKTTGFSLSLVSLSFLSSTFFFFVWLFSQTFFVFGFELTQALNQVSFSLPPLFFFLYYCYLLHMLMNWFPLPHLIQGVLGLEWGWNFLTYKNYRSFCQNLSVYFINKCLLKVFSRRCPVFQLHNSPRVHKCLLLS